MKKTLVIILAMCIMISAAACVAETSAPASNAANANAAGKTNSEDNINVESVDTNGPSEITKNALIHVIGMENQYDAWLSMRDSAILAGQELGVGEVIYTAPAGGEADIQGQIALVENAINAGADAICISCNNSDALVDVLNQAKAAGIVVITFVATANTDSVDMFFAQDNYVSAWNTADLVGQYMNGEGTIGIISAVSGPFTIQQRELGFVDCIAEKYPSITVLDEILYCNNDTAKATNLAHDIMTAHPEIDVIYTTNMPTAEGVLAGITEGGYDVKVAAFDNSDTLEDYLRKGVVIADACGNNVSQGYFPVLAAVKLINGESFSELAWNGQTVVIEDKMVDTGAVIATPDNIDTPEIQGVYHPLTFPDSYAGTSWYE